MAMKSSLKAGVGAKSASRAFRPAVRVSRRTAVQVRADKCLIVNTKVRHACWLERGHSESHRER